MSSPAEKSGIKVLDVVTHVNKTPVSSSHDLLSIVGLKIGAPVFLRIQRSVPVKEQSPGNTISNESNTTQFKVEEHILKGICSLPLLTFLYLVVPEELNVFKQKRIQQRSDTGV